LTLDDIGNFLTTRQVTRQYHPERLVLMADMPKTPSGKLQKFKLREAATLFAATA
jgi:cyclohexanecarboxylate-CoA ligase